MARDEPWNVQPGAINRRRDPRGKPPEPARTGDDALGIERGMNASGLASHPNRRHRGARAENTGYDAHTIGSPSGWMTAIWTTRRAARATFSTHAGAARIL